MSPEPAALRSGEEIDLLWTGGWDSTFRLLSALHLEQAIVRPHYVIDPGSACAEWEIDAMQRVRRAVANARPELSERFLPTASLSLDDLPEDDVHAARFARLRDATALGRHYEWLTRYAAKAGVETLEIGTHKGDPLTAVLEGNLTRVRELPFPAYVLSDAARATDLGLFERFSFPLVDVRRGDMRRIALERGFLDILDQTWFCLRPRRGHPCGVCDKCHTAVVQGLGHRLPGASRRLHDLKWLSRSATWHSVVGRMVG